MPTGLLVNCAIEGFEHLYADAFFIAEGIGRRHRGRVGFMRGGEPAFAKRTRHFIANSAVQV